MYCQMTTVAQAFLAFLAVLHASSRAEASAPAFAGVADPAARAALEEMQRGLQKLDGAMSRQAQELEAQRAHSAALEARLREAEGKLHDREEEGAHQQDVDSNDRGRRLQAAPNSTGEVVHIHRVSVATPEGPGWNISPNYNGGHRRTQKGVCGQISSRAAAVSAECCDEPSEDCSGGVPHTCNVGCAAVFLPFWADCGAQLGPNPEYLSVVTMCEAAGPGSNPSGDPDGLAHQFNLACADGATDGCIPPCAEPLRGDLLLLNLNGNDGKYSCELHHGLHSWVGAATDGGYLGSDARAFVSAVLSGAAGYYALALYVNAGLAVDVVIGPGQDVRITGGASALAWGSGSFTVQQGGALSLVGVALTGALVVQGGGNATVSGGSLGGVTSIQAGGALVLTSTVATTTRFLLAVATTGSYVGPSSIVAHDTQCVRRYTPVDEPWRATSNGGGSHNDFVGLTGGWFRFVGSGGDALPLSSPGTSRCGTQNPGWLSGCDSDALASCTTVGRYPEAAQGVVEMTACFDGGGATGPCTQHKAVAVVRCSDFLLWRLADAPQGEQTGYCTVSSGL
jgi:hypothetical protein